MSNKERSIVTTDPTDMFIVAPHSDDGQGDDEQGEVEMASFPGAVVRLVNGDPLQADVRVAAVEQAQIKITDRRVVATAGEASRSWRFADLEYVVHGSDLPWTILVTSRAPDFGVLVPVERRDELRRTLSELPGVDTRHQRGAAGDDAPVEADGSAAALARSPRIRLRRRDRLEQRPAPRPLTGIDARSVSAWFGDHQVLDCVSLEMPAGEVTALIGPSGCGKSTFLRILNRMHEMIPSAAMAGEVLIDGHDIYNPNRKLTDARREIGMVFQKPNPFPAMSIYDNVLASLRLTGVKASVAVKDATVESCLSKAGLWREVRDRLRQPGGGLSGGQQQRLCIARALAIQPRVLLMDEPCSALDPTSTRRIEETVVELVSEVTIVIVTHNMQQAARVSNRCAFFLAEQGAPGVIVEHGPTPAMFGAPQDPRTSDYVNGRFG